MSYGIFTERLKKPSENEILSALATAKKDWREIVDFIASEFKSKSELKFYGKNYGWALRFNKSGKSLAALYPGSGCFTVQIILTKEQTGLAFDEKLSSAMKDYIKATPEIHEGRWLFIPIDGRYDISEIKTLLLIRGGKLQHT